MSKGFVAAFAMMVLCASGAGPAAAVSPTDKCLTAKHKAAARKIKAKLTCDAKARARSVPVDPNCLARAEAKFAASFVRADAKGVCPGTAAAVEALIDSCVATLGADVPGNGRCQATSVKAEGKAGGCELMCAAKDVLAPGRLALCHPRCDSGLQASLIGSGACGQSPTIQADLHACRDAVIGAFSSATTTTSTTSSTSTSTSSTTSTSTTTTSSTSTSTTLGSP
jgi:hypothetical protein